MTDTERVIDNYIVWELCKQQDIKKKIIEGSTDGKQLKEEIVEKIRQRHQGKDYSLEEKMKQVREVSSNPDHKAKMFEYCSWEKETVKIEDLGTTLPHAMGLPPEIISSTLLDVLEFVKQADPEKYQSIKYINSLKQVPEILNEFHTIAITPGKIIRRQDRMNKAHRNKDWNITDVKAALHDGNHRTVAKILASDLEEVECYVGRPTDDKIYEHVEM